jgi:hypothetical protein
MKRLSIESQNMLAIRDEIQMKFIVYFITLVLVLITFLVCNLNNHLSVVLLVPLVLIRVLEILE